ncbi:hypothetical protein HYN69_20380 (plasmid) [Gemmobacter aquarius]|uniref:N-acetyltransferase domain-containing protein n=1 Tax=Paragemmobacter aquarius TaxID=2169400 RepID=A0A2S0UT03_9RHOB|nr:hypothetical protein [Gemmobacter aquarius]AWB50934.1 hypothetical protein HYN69_20380 [Gemmobacter aquarius]
MKQLITTIPLKNLSHGGFEDARLFRGVDSKSLQSIDADWRPVFDSAPPESLPEDAHWEWADKALRALQNPLNYELFSVEKDDKTQGMLMAIKGGSKCFSRHHEHPRAPIIYVDFLATAPWNRPGLAATSPVYRGVGRVLFMAAVSLSIEEEFVGRVGLHSLPGAEGFYRQQLSMTDLGKDDAYYGLRYFELSANQASQLIAGGL